MYDDYRLVESAPKPFKAVQNGFRTFRIEDSFQTGMTVPFPHDTMEKRQGR